jgi:predicted phage terminase large subunit-like protein
LKRRQSRKSLLPFTEYTNTLYQAAPHHRLIVDALEAVERGEIKRLMVCMPPRHGKSELASRRFPAWFIGRNPSRQIIAASYNADLATDFGREVRNIVNSPEFKALFPEVTLSQDSQAANRWHTSAGGIYVAAGVGTAVTGRGADVLLIDDPFKDRQEADSELQRKRVWDWFVSTAYTRLMPGGAIVVINTRWHDDDLSGRLLAQASEDWKLLSLPALTAGEALWPEWYPVERLEQIRSTIGDREWSALYQQNPAPDEGDYFKRDWFGEYDQAPKSLNVFAASDYAVTDGSGDYTEHGVIGVDWSGDWYVLDWWRGQTTADEWIDRKCDLIKRHKPQRWFGEAGVIRKAIEPYLKRRMEERHAYCWIEWLPSISDKPTRARSFQALASMGKVKLPKNAPWKGDLLSQLLRFPAGKHDDGVDVLSLLGRGMEMVTDATPEQPPETVYVQENAWMN